MATPLEEMAVGAAVGAIAGSKQKIDQLHTVELKEGGVTFKTRQPVKIRFIRNTEKSGYFGSKFQQDIEPAGKYLLHLDWDPGDRPPSEGWEIGEQELRSPLVLTFTTDGPDVPTLYGPGSWKARLHEAYKASGCKLTKALRADGYDSIVTVWVQSGVPSHTKEIVLLPEDCKPRRRRNPEVGLEQELSDRMGQAFSVPYDDVKVGETAKWFKETFRFDTARTPSGQKKLKELAKKLHWFLQAGGSRKVGGDIPKVWPGDESYWREARRVWSEDIQPMAGDLVRYFSDEGGKVVPKEMKVGDRTYLNLVGFDEKALSKHVQALEAVFAEVKDWRRKALSGLKVALADPRHFHGTAGGKYKSEDDVLYVRATPAVLKRAKGTYGSFDYIIVHELGHRYDRKHGTKYDFDRQEWWTSPYSKNGDDEPFAELFALSNSGIRGFGGMDWGSTLDKFERLMEEPKPNPSAAELSEMELWHGSRNEDLHEIKSTGVFGGLFASTEKKVALGHGSKLYRIMSPKPLTDYELNYEIEGAFDVALEVAEGDEVLAKAMLEVGCVIPGEYQTEQSEIMDRLDVSEGQLGWEIQRMRGELARRLGYTSVEMEDEGGTSWLCLSGCKIERIT